MSKSSQSQTSSTTIPGMGQQERDIVNQLQGIGGQQADALRQALDMAGQNNPFSLNLDPATQALVDQAFTGAESNLRRQAGLIGQDLAGTRGLNTSDTPVSEAVLREILPQMQMLQSQKAQQSLGLGLNLAQMGEGRRQFNLSSLLQGTQATPAAFAGLANRFQAERMAQPSTTTRQSYTPSIMSSIGQGIGLASSLGALGMGAMGGMGGLGSIGSASNVSSANGLTSFNQGGYNFLVNTPGAR